MDNIFKGRQVRILFVIAFVASILGTMSSGANGCTVDSDSPLKIVLLDKKVSPSEIKLALRIDNISNKLVLLASEPTLVSGKSGLFSAFDEKARLLSLSSKVFPAPLNPPYSDYSGVSLRPLLDGETRVFRFSVNFPLRETDPPFDQITETNKLVRDTKNVKSLSFEIGYFLDTPGIRSILRKKLFGWTVQGDETVELGPNKGKTLRDLQQTCEIRFEL